MERLHLQRLARAKIEDARLLLDHGRAANADDGGLQWIEHFW